MNALTQVLRRLVKDETGTETLEWGLICGLIVVGAITALVIVGPKITTMWNNLSNSMSGIQ